MKRLLEKMLRDAEAVGLILLGIGLTFELIMVVPVDSKPQKHSPSAHRTKA